jgi:ribosomal protein L31E
MSQYKSLVEKALNKSPKINESILYPDNIKERMHPDIEENLRLQRHSLGKHPAIPEGDEHSFEQKIMGERFAEVANRYKRAFDVESIDNKSLLSQMMPMVMETMQLESKHRKELEDLAVKMIREEYQMNEDVVDIVAELEENITLEGVRLNPSPVKVDMEFDSHDDIENATQEVYKRRLLNAMTQGAAKKCNHMFHMVDDELTNIDPRLPNRYAKMMAAADYMYYVIPKMENGVTGGMVKVEFPTKKNPKPKIHAQAMVFPVLIHELVKGVMEILSAHGLPKDKNLTKFVMGKADFVAAEPDDMRLGSAIWGRFADAIDGNDFHLKHHIYSDLVKLPAKDFHAAMREILAGTKKGRKIIKDIVDAIKNDMKMDDYEDSIDNGEFDEFL